MLDARLIALDGVTGSPCKDFGNNGEVSLDRDVRVQEQECDCLRFLCSNRYRQSAIERQQCSFTEIDDCQDHTRQTGARKGLLLIKIEVVLAFGTESSTICHDIHIESDQYSTIVANRITYDQELLRSSAVE